jgi:hypothetical protein
LDSVGNGRKKSKEKIAATYGSGTDVGLDLDMFGLPKIKTGCLIFIMKYEILATVSWAFKSQKI